MQGTTRSLTEAPTKRGASNALNMPWTCNLFLKSRIVSKLQAGLDYKTSTRGSHIGGYGAKVNNVENDLSVCTPQASASMRTWTHINKS